MPTFLKPTEPQQADQLDTFAANIPVHGPTVNVSPGEIASSLADALYFRYCLAALLAIDHYRQATTEYKDLIKRNPRNLPVPPVPVLILPVAPPTVPAGILDRFVFLGRRMKLHPSYTLSIGQACDIVAIPSGIDFHTYKPGLKA